MLRHTSASILRRCALVSTCLAILALASCNSLKILVNGGEKQVKREPRPPAPGPYVLIFAFDGAGYDQLMTAINSGKAPRMAAMLGNDKGGGLYENAYSAPNAVSILPSDGSISELLIQTRRMRPSGCGAWDCGFRRRTGRNGAPP